MNCFYHAEDAAVATCVDCGKGLCTACAKKYSIPICNDCNANRSKSEKKQITNGFIPTIVLFVIALIAGIFLMSLSSTNTSVIITFGIMFGYLIAGVPWGWNAISFIQPKMFLFMSFFGWLLYFLIKGSISALVGMVAMPIGIIRLIIHYSGANKKADNINNNIKNG